MPRSSTKRTVLRPNVYFTSALSKHNHSQDARIFIFCTMEGCPLFFFKIFANSSLFFIVTEYFNASLLIYLIKKKKKKITKSKMYDFFFF